MSKLKLLSSIPVLAALLCAGTAASPPPAEAGVGYPSSAGCRYEKLTATYRCWGTLRDFRSSPDANAAAVFHTSFASDGTSSRGFGASINGQTFGCTVLPWRTSEAVWAQLLSNPDLYFVISYSTDWACRIEELNASSGYLD